jgi:hypothetical protein
MKIAERISLITGLPQDKADKVVEEVLSALDMTLEEYIMLRHQELSKTHKNEDIFAIIQSGVQDLRFKSKHLSIRQIRRKIYG